MLLRRCTGVSKIYKFATEIAATLATMEEPFILEVEHKGVRHALNTQLQMRGYTHHFAVALPQMEIWFERDEEGLYRALLPPGTEGREADKLDKGFIQVIANQLEAILK